METVAERSPPAAGLNEMRLAELRRLASRCGIRNYCRYRKTQLVALILAGRIAAQTASIDRTRPERAAATIQRWWRRRSALRNDRDPITLERLPSRPFLLVEGERSVFRFDPDALAEAFVHTLRFENPVTRRSLQPWEVARLDRATSDGVAPVLPLYRERERLAAQKEERENLMLCIGSEISDIVLQILRLAEEVDSGGDDDDDYYDEQRALVVICTECMPYFHSLCRTLAALDFEAMILAVRQAVSALLGSPHRPNASVSNASVLNCALASIGNILRAFAAERCASALTVALTLTVPVS